MRVKEEEREQELAHAREKGSMTVLGVWRYGSMAVWEYDGMGVWRYGSMTVWEYDGMWVRRYGS